MKQDNNIPQFTLTPEERARMRHSLNSYMAMKPLPSAAQSSAWSFDWLYSMSMRPAAFAFVVALFASTAGISYAASDALPGDWLYGVKTNINEPVQGALAVSARAKSEWAIDVASTRLQEAATLAAAGKLDADTQQQLKTNFDKHAKAAAQLIEQQASTSPDTGIASAVSFEAQLSEYERVLAEVGAATDMPTEGIASAVRDAQASVGTIRADAQAKVALAATTSRISGKLAASRMRDIARAQLADSLKLAHADDGSLDAPSANAVSAQLDDTNSTLREGDDALATDDTSRAQGAFESALSAAQKLNVFLKTTAAIHRKTGLTIGGSAGQPDAPTAALMRAAKAAPAAPTTMMAFSMSATSSEEATSSETTATGTALEEDEHDAAHENETDEDEHTLRISVPTYFRLH